MKRAVLTTTLVLAAATAATSARAFEVTGGSVALGYSGFTDNLLKKMDKTTLGGSIELGFSQTFSVQADLTFINFGFSDLEAHNFGLHSIYHVSETTSLGMYFGQDRVDGGSLSVTGVEVGHQAGQFGMEAYLTYTESGGDDGIVFGARADYSLKDNAQIGLRYDDIGLDELDASRLSLTAQYTLSNGLALTGELGSVDLADAGSEPFFGIGARMTFGAKRGATFEERSVLNLLPGL